MDVQPSGCKNVKQENTDVFPCPSCGGNMVFNPDTQSLSCAYCGNVINIETQKGSIKEYDIESGEENAPKDWGSEKRVIHCESCGADTVLDADSTAAFCAFCGSSHIVKHDGNYGIAPESIVPFKISGKKAEDYFLKWIKKRYFAPNALKTNYKSGGMNGLYIPYWTYDSDTYSAYTAEAGTYYYETVNEWVEENGHRKMVTRQVRKIRWQYVSGTYNEYFDDICVNASRHVDSGLIKKIEPFNLSELVHYKPEFLSGFLAERYSIGLKEGWENAKGIIDRQINSGIVRKISADEVRNLNISTSYNSVRFKHILLPVWIASYTYNNKVYRYMINGQTGEVQGSAPLSPWKITALVLAITAVLCLVFYFLRFGKSV